MEANEVKVSSLDEFRREIRKLKKSGGKARKMIYRGQSDAAWKVNSTAYRTLKEMNNNEDPSSRDLLDTNEELIEVTYHVDVQELGETIYDLLILAKLRLKEATNLLIDFTETPEVALWYACNNDKDTNKGEDRAVKIDSKVFCLDIGSNSRFHKISRENQKKYLSALIESLEGKIAVWQPPLDPRVATQDSYFIFNEVGKLEDGIFDKIIIIDEKARDKIYDDIDILSNFSDRRLSLDFQGIVEKHRYGNKVNPQPTGDEFKDNKPAEPESVGGAFETALKHQEEGAYEEAIESYGQAIKDSPDSVAAYNNRGNAKAMLERYGEAIADFDEAIRRDSDFVRAYSNRGNAKFALKRYEDAIKDHDEALKRDSNFASAYNNRGNAKFALGRYEDAIEDFDDAIRLAPNSAPTYSNRANAKAMLQRDDEALEDFDKVIQLAPDFAPAYFQRGNFKHSRGNYKAAIADYDTAISKKPDYAEAYRNRGLAKKALGLDDEAQKDFDKARKI